MNGTEDIKMENDPLRVIGIYFKKYRAMEKWEKILNGYV